MQLSNIIVYRRNELLGYGKNKISKYADNTMYSIYINKEICHVKTRRGKRGGSISRSKTTIQYHKKIKTIINLR